LGSFKGVFDQLGWEIFDGQFARMKLGWVRTKSGMNLLSV